MTYATLIDKLCMYNFSLKLEGRADAIAALKNYFLETNKSLLVTYHIFIVIKNFSNILICPLWLDLLIFRLEILRMHIKEGTYFVPITTVSFVIKKN